MKNSQKKRLIHTTTKPHVADLPIDEILRIASKATRNAALAARRAGRAVTGMQDGKVVDYGPLFDVVKVDV